MQCDTSRTLDPQTTLVAFGDSIANGLGSHGQPYPVIVAEYLRARYVDLTGTGATIADALERRQQAAGANIALIGFGITEAMIRPTPGALRLLPRRWRRPGWMDPRPYYSRRRWKRVGQIVESGIRWRIKVALIRLTGGIRWMHPELYEESLVELVDSLESMGISTIVIISQLGHDSRFFPKSAESFDEFMAINKGVAETKKALFCDATTVCERWNDYLADHFHPNSFGHKRIAAHLIEILTEAVGSQRILDV